MLHPQMENYAAKKKNKEYLYELIWSDFQDTWLRENSKMQKSIYGILPFVLEKEKGNKRRYTYKG